MNRLQKRESTEVQVSGPGSPVIPVNFDRAEAIPVASASSILPPRRLRIPLPDLRTEPAFQRLWPSRRDEPPRPRYRARARRLTADQESTIRARAATKSLRSLSAQFWISHETILAVVRRAHPVTGYPLGLKAASKECQIELQINPDQTASIGNW